MYTLNAQDIRDIVTGATLYGSGGGGPIWMGHQIAGQIADAPVKLINKDDVSDESQMAITSFFGDPDRFRNSKVDYSHLSYTAFKQLEKQQQVTFDYVVPLEVGAGNSLIPIAVAALGNIPVIDGDGAHRAIPTPFAFTWSSLPVGTISACSDTAQVQLSGMSHDSQSIPANLATVMQAFAAMVFGDPALITGSGASLWTMTGKQIKSVAVPGGLSDSLELGRSIRSAKDPVEVAVDILKGELLGIGRLVSANIPAIGSNGGFGTGQAIFKKAHDILTVISVSENVLVWSDQSCEPLAIAPDLISYITPAGQVLSALDLQDLSQGEEVAIIRSPGVKHLYQPPFSIAFAQVLLSAGYAGKIASDTD